MNSTCSEQKPHFFTRFTVFSCFNEPGTLYIYIAITYSQDEKSCCDAQIHKELSYLFTAGNKASERSSPELEILRRQQIITSSCTLYILRCVSDCFRGFHTHTHTRKTLFLIFC